MRVLDTLPNRPLERSDEKWFERKTKIQGYYPVYGEKQRHEDTAFSAVIVIDGTAHGVAYNQDEQWILVESREVDANKRGIHSSEHDNVRDLQKTAAIQAGAVFEH